MFRIASVAAAASIVVLLGACETNQIKPPVDSNAVVWTRVPKTEGINTPLYPEWRDSTIAFQYFDAFGNVHLGRIKLDGSNLVLYTELGPSIDIFPRWVSDSVLIYCSNKNGGGFNHFDIWYRNINTETERILTFFPELEFNPVPRPGMPSYAYIEGGAYPGFKGQVTLLPDTTNGAVPRIYLTPDTLKAGEPDWDPSGNRLAFSADDPYGARNIWLMTLSGTSVVSMRRLTTEGVHDYTPRFSPDGTKIVFRSDRSGKAGLWWVSPDSVNMAPRLITFGDAGDVIVSPSWSPDGKEIIVFSNTQGVPALWRLSNLGF